MFFCLILSIIVGAHAEVKTADRLCIKGPSSEIRMFKEYALDGNCLSRLGKPVATLDSENINNLHYHPFEVVGDEVFWINRVGDVNAGKNWEDQLLVTNLKTKTTEKLISQQGMDFRVSPDGKKIAFLSGDDAKLFVRAGKNISMIAKSCEYISEGQSCFSGEAFTFLSWSSDSSRFWLGGGVSGGWQKLGLYESGKSKWFPYSEGGGSEGLLDPDRGWLVVSTIPFFYDTYSEEDFEKKNTSTYLFLVDVISGKKADLAQGVGTKFKPAWVGSGGLEFTQNGKIVRLTEAEIRAKLK